jgi:hypothetical protein
MKICSIAHFAAWSGPSFREGGGDMFSSESRWVAGVAPRLVEVRPTAAKYWAPRST